MRSFKGLCVAIFWNISAVVSNATDLQSVTLAPVQHETAAIVVQSVDGSTVRYTPADLEAFPTYQLVTATPWRKDAAAFSGVLLSDILARHGLDSGVPIRVTAENEFTVIFDRAALAAAPVLVATRVNGHPHTRRDRGPIQFVIDFETYRASDALREAHFVWMAARIEPGR